MSDFFDLLIHVLVENILAIIAIVLSLTAIIADWHRGKKNRIIAIESNQIAKNSFTLSREANNIAMKANQLAKEANSIEEKNNSFEYEVLNNTKATILKLTRVLQSILEKYNYFAENGGCLDISEENEYLKGFRLAPEYTIIIDMIKDEKHKISFKKNILTLACGDTPMESLPILIGEIDCIITTEQIVVKAGLQNKIIPESSTPCPSPPVEKKSEKLSINKGYHYFKRFFINSIISKDFYVDYNTPIVYFHIEPFLDYLKIERRIKDPDVLLFYGSKNNDIELVKQALKLGANASVSIYEILIRYENKLMKYTMNSIGKSTNNAKSKTIYTITYKHLNK